MKLSNEAPPNPIESPWKTRPPSSARAKGKFIVLEGIDGAGKTTQGRLLAQCLTSRGSTVVLTAEPSDGPEGVLLRSLKTRLTPEEEARLFTEDRRHHVKHVIGPSLEAGFVVICDRYVYSSVAYQGARGIDQKRIISWNKPFLVAPNVIFLLELPVDLALDRIGTGRFEGSSPFEGRDNLEAVDAIYRRLVDPLIQRIDSRGDQEAVHDSIVRALAALPEFAEFRLLSKA